MPMLNIAYQSEHMASCTLDCVKGRLQEVKKHCVNALPYVIFLQVDFAPNDYFSCFF